MDVREIYLGEQGILAGADAGIILIDMTTTGPPGTQAMMLALEELSYPDLPAQVHP